MHCFTFSEGLWACHGGPCNLYIYIKLHIYKTSNNKTATVTTDTESFNYIGMSEPPLRYRVASHYYSFKTSNNKTVLSEKIKYIKSQNKNFDLRFRIIENKKSYVPETKRCELCIAEKFQIIYSNMENILNKKSEIISKCRHKWKYKLGAIG